MINSDLVESFANLEDPPDVGQCREFWRFQVIQRIFWEALDKIGTMLKKITNNI